MLPRSSTRLGLVALVVALARGHVGLGRASLGSDRESHRLGSGGEGKPLAKESKREEDDRGREGKSTACSVEKMLARKK